MSLPVLEEHPRFDQVLEKRTNPLEIAAYIKELLDQGMQKKDIAVKLHKSNSFITQHLGLLALPDKVKAAYASGQITDITAANEAAALYAKTPAAMDKLLASGRSISRTQVKEAKAKIRIRARRQTNESKIETLENPLITVSLRGEHYQLLYRQPPKEPGEVWIKSKMSQQIKSVMADRVKVVSITEAYNPAVVDSHNFSS